MAENYTITIPAHRNIYNNISNRDLQIEFCIPSQGTNEHTGILLLVPGFGGSINSKIYQKMRTQFADQYNLITVQCDYFGNKYMQSTETFVFDDSIDWANYLSMEEMKKVTDGEISLLDCIKNKEITIPVKAKLDESLDEFNDMGYMQAIDLITAIEAVKILVKENDMIINFNRIIGYGHSHGSYLLYLANKLLPNLFSYIIDNSAWIQPLYLKYTRILRQNLDKATLNVEFIYIAHKEIKNKQNLNLHHICKGFSTNTQLIVFQGDQDSLVDHQEKQQIISRIENASFHLITKKEVDGIKYKSNTHGLNADFLELFKFAMQYEQANKNTEINDFVRVQFEDMFVEVNTQMGLPLFDFQYLNNDIKI